MLDGNSGKGGDFLMRTYCTLCFEEVLSVHIVGANSADTITEAESVNACQPNDTPFDGRSHLALKGGSQWQR